MDTIPLCSAVRTTVSVTLSNIGNMAYTLLGDVFGIMIPEWEEAFPTTQDMYYYFRVASRFR